MKKIILLPLFALLLSSAVLAGGYKCGGHGGWIAMKLIGFLLASFLFSIIFWWTYLWIVNDKGKLLKKKK